MDYKPYIINKDDLHPFLGTQFAGLGTDLVQFFVGYFVNIERGVAKNPQSIAYPPEIIGGNLPASHFGSVHRGGAGNKTLGKGHIGHLQREKRDRSFVIKSDMGGHIQGKGGFSYGRTGADNNKVGGLKARCHFIQFFKPGGDSGQRILGFIHFLYFVKCRQ